MLQAMFDGVSGIEAHQTRMDAIGNNIANVDTTAYKSTQVSFDEQLSQIIQGSSAGDGVNAGGTNGIAVGLGVKVGSVDTNMEQGGLQSTSTPTDLAIQGNGYFMLGNGSAGAVDYTRDGSFQVDNNGNLVSAATGQYVLGWQADTGTGTVDTSKQITGASHLSIPVGSLTSVYPTSTATLGGNLSADTSVTAAAAPATDYNRSVKVYDSLGEAHVVNMSFYKSATNQWTWTASKDSTDTSTATISGSGTVTFDTSGAETASTGGVTLNAGLNPATNGATAPQTITPDFSKSTQVSGQSSVAPVSQNGFGPGTLSSFSIDQTGAITGIFNNGQTRVLGQIALANFSNPQGLQSTGTNNFEASNNSGLPQVGTATVSGLGQISAGYLEQSNVDLSNEFTNMIITQRGYEANTKIISTVDQMLQDIINTKQG